MKEYNSMKSFQFHVVYSSPCGRDRLLARAWLVLNPNNVQGRPSRELTFTEQLILDSSTHRLLAFGPSPSLESIGHCQIIFYVAGSSYNYTARQISVLLILGIPRLPQLNDSRSFSIHLISPPFIRS